VKYRPSQVFGIDEFLVPLVKRHLKGWKLSLSDVDRLCFEHPGDSWVLDDWRAEINKNIREWERWLKPPKNQAILDVARAREYPIGDLMGREGINTGPQRTKYKCCLHSEKSESFVWYKHNNSFYCFGCGKGGDVINLYMELYKVNFVEAVKKLS
jgi:hypothetical protein